MILLRYPIQESETLSEERVIELLSGLSVIAIVLIVFFYFLPSIIALFRGKSNTLAIIALNTFLGCTLVGWVIALVWSLTSNTKPIIVNQIKDTSGNGDEFEKLARLKKLLDDGAISEQEYTVQKNKLLNK